MKKLVTLILFFMIVTVRKTCKHYKNQYPFYKKIEMEHNLTSSVFRNFYKFNDVLPISNKLVADIIKYYLSENFISKSKNK